MQTTSFALLLTSSTLMVAAQLGAATVDGPYLKATRPAGQQWTISEPYPGYKLWIPDGVTTVRGLITVQGHETGTEMYNDYDPWQGTGGDAAQGYRSLAKRFDFAMYMVPNGNINSNRAGQIAEYWTRLNELAITSGHPEVQFASMIYTGLSAGGFYTTYAAGANPSRMIGFVPIAGADDSVDTAAGRLVPGLFINQGQDGFYPGSGVSVRDNCQNGRNDGAPWGWGLTNTGHSDMTQQDFQLLWMEEMIKLRLPVVVPTTSQVSLNTVDVSSGWLGDVRWHDTGGRAPLVIDSVEIYRAAAYGGDPSQLVWFANERLANAWKFYLTTGNRNLTTDSSAPTQAPSGLAAGARSQTTLTITWSPLSHSADPETGIDGYAVYRNGVRVGYAVGASFVDLGLTAGTSYVYAVAAVNPANREGARSATLTVSTTTGSGSRPGDANGDGVVDAADIALVESHMGRTSTGGGWNASADVDANQRVDAADVSLVVRNQGN